MALEVAPPRAALNPSVWVPVTLAFVASPVLASVFVVWTTMGSHLASGRSWAYALAGLPLGFAWIGPIALIVSGMVCFAGAAVCVAIFARIQHLQPAPRRLVYAAAFTSPLILLTALTTIAGPLLSLSGIVSIPLTFGLAWAASLALVPND